MRNQILEWPQFEGPKRCPPIFFFFIVFAFLVGQNDFKEVKLFWLNLTIRNDPATTIFIEKNLSQKLRKISLAN